MGNSPDNEALKPRTIVGIDSCHLRLTLDAALAGRLAGPEDLRSQRGPGPGHQGTRSCIANGRITAEFNLRLDAVFNGGEVGPHQRDVGLSLAHKLST